MVGRNLKILILSQWCYPEPDLKALTFAKALQQRGHTVQILTGFPNYPGGKVYEGYKISLFKREKIDGIEILRCALYPNHDRSAFKRILNYLSFAFFAGFAGIFKVSKADVMYVYHPPATVAIPALMIKFFRGIPVVYDIQDMWPDTLKVTGMLNNPRLLKMIGAYMNACYKRVNHITVLSRGFRELLIERGVPASKVSVIYNWSNPINVPDFVDEEEKTAIMGNRFCILFAGTIGLAQGLDVVIRCAERLKGAGETDIEFVLLGGGVDVARLKEQVESIGLDNIRFLGRVPNSEVGKYLAMADVLLIHLVKDKLFEITVPSKTQAYLLAGKPILVGVEGDAANLVNAAAAGYNFSPEDDHELAEKVLLLKNMSKQQLAVLGDNGRRYYNDQLSIEIGAKKFEELFMSLQKDK
jgi:glycosyltransferase involved in cell wall biosynthesis